MASGDLPAVEVVRWSLAIVTLAVALGFLSVGGAWLVVSRLGLQPFDLSTDIVRLTAVHFHYAGFGLALLAATGLACADWMASRVALSIGSIASIAGPPMVAVGFVTGSALGQVGGAVVVTVAGAGRGVRDLPARHVQFAGAGGALVGAGAGPMERPHAAGGLVAVAAVADAPRGAVGAGPAGGTSRRSGCATWPTRTASSTASAS